MTSAPETKPITMTDEDFQQALENLRYVVVSQNNTHRVLGNRVRMLIRSLVVGLVSALAFILYLLYLLTMQIDVFSDSLKHITEEAESVQLSIDHIEMSVAVFEAYMRDMSEMNASVEKIDKSLLTMTKSVSGVTRDVQQVAYELNQLQASLQQVTGNVQTLDNTLLNINKDVDTAAKPFENFNKMMPF
jgi:prefoldin subunit 5